MKWLDKFFRRESKLSPEPKQMLSVENLIKQRISEGKCPDCLATNSLMEGPSGGLSMNIACNKCGAEFNIGAFGAFGNTLLFAERNSPKNQPDIERLRSVFRIELKKGN